MQKLSCPSCSNVAMALASRVQLSVLRCSFCDLVFATEVEGSVNVTAESYYHDTVANFSWHSLRAERLLSRRLLTYQRFLGRPVQKVLEIGCGSGAFASAFKALGCTYTGVEFDPRIAAIAREKSAAQIFAGDFLTYRSVDTYDLVFFSQVLEHVGNPTAFMTKVREVSPGGMVHLDVPNQDSLASRGRIRFGKHGYGTLYFPSHMIGYNKKSMLELTSRVGFRQVNIETHANNHEIWGVPTAATGFTWSVYYRLCEFTGGGSLLTVLARS